jgi:hypothetical protein
MDKAVCFSANNSKMIVNNLCVDSIDSRFLFAESSSIVTVDEVNNFTLFIPTPFLQADKYVEVSGGKILTPKKQSSLTINNNYSNTIKSFDYNSTYPVGNNDYNENLNLNLTSEISNLVGTNWIKARITFQGNDYGTASGYVIIDAFQSLGVKNYVIASVNAGATLVGDVLKIPTIAIAGGGHWYKMKGIYEITISV